MKQLLIVLSVLFFSSCSTAPDNIIHNQKTEKGNWVYDSQFNKPIQENVEFVKIAPTWGQAFYYAKKRSDHPLFIGLSVLLFLCFFILFFGKTFSASWFPEYLDDKLLVFNTMLFIFLVGSVSLFMTHPIGIKWNNDKWIEKSVFDKTIETSGSTQPIWDSLQNNCLIVDGPYGCYTK